MKLTILSPERKLLEGVQIEDIVLPTAEGEIQILPGHAAMVGMVRTGIFSYQIPGQQRSIGAMSFGFFEVSRDVVTVTVETLEMANEINMERARKAQLRAEEMLNQASLDEHQFKKYQLKLERSLIRQRVGG